MNATLHAQYFNNPFTMFTDWFACDMWPFLKAITRKHLNGSQFYPNPQAFVIVFRYKFCSHASTDTVKFLVLGTIVRLYMKIVCFYARGFNICYQLLGRHGFSFSADKL